MKKNKALSAFTLIELLMVIAIIGILAGVLIPAVGLVKEKANIATSKVQLSQYLSALQSFKGEYGYYPFRSSLDAVGTDGELNLSVPANSELFYETLAARDFADPATPVSVEGNRRRIQFYTFQESEIADDTYGASIAEGTIVDAFGNNNIRIVIDLDGDGVVTVPDPDGGSGATKEIRSSLTAYVIRNNDLNFPGYYLFD